LNINFVLFLETIRMYPALPILNRECTQDYPIPGSHLTIKKGTSIIISLFGMHRDPKYFPEPDKFLPERFAAKNYDEVAYIPFGDGPRNCIGLRMGKMFAKVAIVLLLKSYNFINVDDRPIEYATSTVTLVSKNGINLKVSQRKK
jgi:cytochrome P450 family 6